MVDTRLPWRPPVRLNLPVPNAPVESFGVLTEDLRRFWHCVLSLVEILFYTLAAGHGSALGPL